MLWISYRANPDACAAFLPTGLQAGDDLGNAAIAFFDWQWCTDDREELRYPQRAQFRECLITLTCALDGRPAARIAFAWVDSYVPLVRGFIQGIPKKFGSVWITRSFSVGLASSCRATGGMFSGILSADSEQIATALVRLDDVVDQPPPLATYPAVQTRHFPSWHPGESPLEELVIGEISDVKFSEVWSGSADLMINGADPDLAALAPVEVGRGYVFSYGETLRPGRRVPTQPQ